MQCICFPRASLDCCRLRSLRTPITSSLGRTMEICAYSQWDGVLRRSLTEPNSTPHSNLRPEGSISARQRMAPHRPRPDLPCCISWLYGPTPRTHRLHHNHASRRPPGPQSMFADLQSNVRFHSTPHPPSILLDVAKQQESPHPKRREETPLPEPWISGPPPPFPILYG